MYTDGKFINPFFCANARISNETFFQAFCCHNHVHLQNKSLSLELGRNFCNKSKVPEKENNNNDDHRFTVNIHPYLEIQFVSRQMVKMLIELKEMTC